MWRTTDPKIKNHVIPEGIGKKKIRGANIMLKYEQIIDIIDKQEESNALIAALNLNIFTIV